MMNIEQDLVAALEPIRQMTLAICVNHFFETGVYRKLEAGECDLDTLSRSLDLERARLGGLLGYLRNENIVSHDKGVYALTDKARLLGRYSAWYTMLVGGYTETFVQVGECLKGQGKWATRDVGGKVGIGSCGISHYDAIPLTQRLMAKWTRQPGRCCWTWAAATPCTWSNSARPCRNCAPMALSPAAMPVSRRNASSPRKDCPTASRSSTRACATSWKARKT